jgi:hypothetical protein
MQTWSDGERDRSSHSSAGKCVRGYLISPLLVLCLNPLEQLVLGVKWQNVEIVAAVFASGHESCKDNGSAPRVHRGKVRPLVEQRE